MSLELGSTRALPEAESTRMLEANEAEFPKPLISATPQGVLGPLALCTSAASLLRRFSVFRGGTWSKLEKGSATFCVALALGDPTEASSLLSPESK